jgi:hypothetical protein
MNKAVKTLFILATRDAPDCLPAAYLKRGQPNSHFNTGAPAHLLCAIAAISGVARTKQPIFFPSFAKGPSRGEGDRHERRSAEAIITRGFDS